MAMNLSPRKVANSELLPSRFLDRRKDDHLGFGYPFTLFRRTNPVFKLVENPTRVKNTTDHSCRQSVSPVRERLCSS